MYSALSPIFNIDWNNPTPSAVEGNGLKKTGNGFGVDIGVTAEFLNDFTFSCALTDLGTMTWNGNVYEAKDQYLNKMESDGFDSYNIFKEAQQINEYFDIFEWQGLNEKKVGLPSLLRIGFQYEKEKIGLGVDFLNSLSKTPGTMEKAMFNFGGWYKPAKWVELSTGIVTGGNYKVNLPVGLTFNFGDTWELGLAVRDYKTYFSQNTPNASVVMGMLRFGL